MSLLKNLFLFLMLPPDECPGVLVSLCRLAVRTRRYGCWSTWVAVLGARRSFGGEAAAGLQGLQEVVSLGNAVHSDIPVWHISSKVSTGRASATEIKELPLWNAKSSFTLREKEKCICIYCFTFSRYSYLSPDTIVTEVSTYTSL